MEELKVGDYVRCVCGFDNHKIGVITKINFGKYDNGIKIRGFNATHGYNCLIKITKDEALLEAI